MIKWTLKPFYIDQLKDHPKNPRKLTKEQYAHLKTSIEKFGLIDKPVCTQAGLIIGGHQRKNVLKKLGKNQIDCYVPDRELTEQEIDELCIRLNKNTGSFDHDILANQFDVLELVSWGFSPIEFEDVMEEKPKKPQKEKSMKTCPSCGCELG